MKHFFKSALLLLPILAFITCQDKNSKVPEGETILKGEISILVDETLLPIMEDEVAVFESEYDAKVRLIPKSEAEVVQALLKDSNQVAVMARRLSFEELKFFTSRKRYPKETPFATDAIALVANKSQDSTIVLSQVLDVLKGKPSDKIKGLVFDNLNSGTLRQLAELAGVRELPSKGVYSYKTNAEVLKFVSENPGMIGVVGINWIVQPTEDIQTYLKNIQVLDVQGLENKGFFAPTQNNLAEKTYPLARPLYFVNAQGYDGLGIGFASFVAGERGQRIILKSGLLPEHIPSRKIVIKKTL